MEQNEKCLHSLSVQFCWFNLALLNPKVKNSDRHTRFRSRGIPVFTPHFFCSYRVDIIKHNDFMQMEVVVHVYPEVRVMLNPMVHQPQISVCSVCSHPVLLMDQLDAVQGNQEIQNFKNKINYIQSLSVITCLSVY